MALFKTLMLYLSPPRAQRSQSFKTQTYTDLRNTFSFSKKKTCAKRKTNFFGKAFFLKERFALICVYNLFSVFWCLCVLCGEI